LASWNMLSSIKRKSRQALPKTLRNGRGAKEYK